MNFSQPLNYSNMDIINNIQNNSFNQNDINTIQQPENNFQKNINNTELEIPPENNADMQRFCTGGQAEPLVCAPLRRNFWQAQRSRGRPTCGNNETMKICARGNMATHLSISYSGHRKE